MVIGLGFYCIVILLFFPKIFGCEGEDSWRSRVDDMTKVGTLYYTYLTRRAKGWYVWH